MTDSCKDAPSSLVKVVLRMGSWVIRFAFSFQFYSRRTTTFAEPACKFNLTLAVEDIEKLSKELGFQKFTLKKTARFLTKDHIIIEKQEVLDKEGNIEYYLEKAGLIDKTTKFKAPSRGDNIS